jgi:hypothetical protein
VDDTRTQCLDLGQSTVDFALVTELLGSSNILPKTTLILEADTGVLVVGSPEQSALKANLAADMASALRIAMTSIKVTSIREAAVGGRRRMQASVAVQFDFIVSDAPVEALTELIAQLSNPSSALRTSSTLASVVPSSIAYSFTCPQGLYRPEGVADCMQCAGNRIPNYEDNLGSCKDCGSREAPDDIDGSTCVCAAGYYDSTHSVIKCYEHGAYYMHEDDLAVLNSRDQRSSTDVCMPCTGLDCVDCQLGHTELRAGYSLSGVKIAQGANFDNVHGQRGVFPCPQGNLTCTGDITSPCRLGAAGPLCSTCDNGFSRPGLQGLCTECDDTLSVVWIVFAGILVIVVVAFLLFFISTVDTSRVSLSIMVFGKIAITLMQILTQLEVALELNFPPVFKWFINLLNLFSFDFMTFIDIGCLASYSYFSKFTIALCMIPVLLTIVALVYCLRKRKAKGEQQRTAVKNQCIKMALASMFLSYAFVSPNRIPCLHVDSVASRVLHSLCASGPGEPNDVSSEKDAKLAQQPKIYVAVFPK